MKSRPGKIYWAIAAVVILLALLVFIDPPLRMLFMHLFHLRTIAEVRSYVDSLGAWGPVIMIALMVVHSVTFVPSEIIMITDVGLFGPVWGIVYSWVGSMLGAYLSFFSGTLDRDADCEKNLYRNVCSIGLIHFLRRKEFGGYFYCA